MVMLRAPIRTAACWIRVGVVRKEGAQQSFEQHGEAACRGRVRQLLAAPSAARKWRRSTSLPLRPQKSKSTPKLHQLSFAGGPRSSITKRAAAAALHKLVCRVRLSSVPSVQFVAMRHRRPFLSAITRSARYQSPRAHLKNIIAWVACSNSQPNHDSIVLTVWCA